MIDDQLPRSAGAAGPAGPAGVVRSWVELLGSVAEGLEAVGCVEMIGELETLESAAEAVQAAAAVRVHAPTGTIHHTRPPPAHPPRPAA